jgi:hypothetical protein
MMMRSAPLLAILAILSFAAAILMLVFGIWWLVLLGRYRRGFLQAARQAAERSQDQPTAGTISPADPSGRTPSSD